jgi:splicing factor 3A subunit 2
MDYQNQPGSRFGGGGVASKEETAMDRRKRLFRLAVDSIDLTKGHPLLFIRANCGQDPYIRKTHMGLYECKLCLTVHVNEGSYLVHTQGKKHQTNLARRAAMEQKSGICGPSTALLTSLYGTNALPVKKNFMKIGRPGYKITKLRDPVTQQPGLLFQSQFPQITWGVKPRFRFMSTWEQKIEQADKRFQYLIIAAEPYDSVGFRIQSCEVDRREGKLWTHWDRKSPTYGTVVNDLEDIKQYSLQFFYKTEREERYAGVPGLAPGQ